MFKKLNTLVIVLTLVLSASISLATNFDLPELHAEASMQGVFFSGEDEDVSYLNKMNSAFELRHAVIGAEGELGKYFEYALEIGISSCAGGGCGSSGSISFSEVAALYKPVEYLKLGIYKGHTMRGFELYEECTDVLTAEKPRVKCLFPCHPVGMLVQTEYMFDENMGIDAQLTYNSGGGNTIDDEHDINFGAQFKTPVQGLAIGGFFNDYKWKVAEYDPNVGDFVANSFDGTRISFGVDYENLGINFRSEYYLIDGYVDTSPIRLYTADADTLLAEDLESNSYFIQGGYTFETGQEMLPSVQPYIMYQAWDKASNADGDNKLTYLTMGINLGLGSEHAQLKIDYEFPLNSPDDTLDEAKRLTIRMTGGF